MFTSRRRVVVVRDHNHHRIPTTTLPSIRHAQPRRRRRHRRHGGFLRRSLRFILPVAMMHSHTARAQDPSDPLEWPTETTVPIHITNNCPDTIWPALFTQAGQGPGYGGILLVPGETAKFVVGPTWQGRIWGRTNCSFNAAGTGPANLNGVDGSGKACLTGDCGAVLNCMGTGEIPTTLAEFNLRGGIGNSQTFYDISLVDGYNLPLAIVYIPAPNTTNIPPNLTNPSCVGTTGFLPPPVRVGTTYSNATYPTPWESRLTNANLASWCPWDLQVYPPSKPGDGVYPYPDDKIQRPVFDPCKSACAATNDPAICCQDQWNDPKKCKPTMYSTKAKQVCPDAYSFAYDDTTSTFIIPAGGGWEVVFCPAGRSTDILATFGDALGSVASGGGVVTREVDEVLRNVSYIMTHGSGDGSGALPPEGNWTGAGDPPISVAAPNGVGKGLMLVLGLAVLGAVVVGAG